MLHLVQALEGIRLFTLTLAYYTLIAVASVGIFAGLGFGATVAQALWLTDPCDSRKRMSSNKETLRQLVTEGLKQFRKNDLEFEILEKKVEVLPFSQIETYVIKLFISKQNKEEKNIRPLLLIHGMNTGPLYFRNIFHMVTEGNRNVEMYLLALPGFGLVDIPQEVVSSFSSREILDFYSNYLCEVVKKLFPDTHSKPIVVGHSFGAYLAAACYSRHPDLLQQVIFVNGIGLFPFVGSHGKHWSIFFKMGLPIFFTRPFGSYLHPLLSCVVDYAIKHSREKEDSKLIWMFSAMLLTCPTNFSDVICSRFIDDYFTDSCWNPPIGGELLGKGLTLSFVWGVDDPIISRHLAQLMVECSVFTEPTPFRIVYVLGGGHDPIVWNNGQDFAQAIQHLIDRSVTEPSITTEPETKESHPHATRVMSVLQELLTIQNAGVFCVTTTAHRIEQWCNRLRSKEWFQSKQPTISAISAQGKLQEIVNWKSI
jgi:pimeloyl-ACP methyl ester carboxylesterase